VSRVGAIDQLPFQAFHLALELLHDDVDCGERIRGLGAPVKLVAMASQHGMAGPAGRGRTLGVVSETQLRTLEQWSEAPQPADLCDSAVAKVFWDGSVRTEENDVHDVIPSAPRTVVRPAAANTRYLRVAPG
jgi:hypothetical protein